MQNHRNNIHIVWMLLYTYIYVCRYIETKIKINSNTTIHNSTSMYREILYKKTTTTTLITITTRNKQ